MTDPSSPVVARDLPVHARERLESMRSRKLFTSDLSVNELLLVREAGFEPVGLVMGCSIFQVGRNLPEVPGGQPGCELENTTQALYDARELAMGRMEEEAEALGADGVIGVRLTMNLSKDPRRVQLEQYRVWSRWSKEAGFVRPASVPPAGWFSQWNDLATVQWNLWSRRLGWSQVPFPPWSQAGQSGYTLGPNCAEFMAVGTAIRHRAGEPFRNAQGKPFQSDLSGQDFWMLIRSGYRPVGFVMGNCVYYVPPRTLGHVADKESRELSDYTHALYDARELAIERLQDEAEALGAKGIVGVTVSEHQHSWQTDPWNVGNAALTVGEVLELFVVGTAVVPAGQPALEPPTLVLSASDAGVSRAQGGE
ncbi:MAG: heavy metal-binding domain-containing protein [Polyangiaceae bacterium]